MNQGDYNFITMLILAVFACIIIGVGGLFFALLLT